jgi:hypothetical protein
MEKILIEAEGSLYRGESVYWPTEIWSVDKQKWQVYTGENPKAEGWGDPISEADAEELKKPA